jgi:hypothetical protein
MGNQAFNQGDYPKARDYFTKAQYKDGLIRLGDYYMYEKRLPLLAYGYYKKAGAAAKIEDIRMRMISALSHWLGRDVFKPGMLPSERPVPRVDETGMIPVPVNEHLRKLALEIAEGKHK